MFWFFKVIEMSYYHRHLQCSLIRYIKLMKPNLTMLMLRWWPLKQFSETFIFNTRQKTGTWEPPSCTKIRKTIDQGNFPDNQLRCSHFLCLLKSIEKTQVRAIFLRGNLDYPLIIFKKCILSKLCNKPLWTQLKSSSCHDPTVDNHHSRKKTTICAIPQVTEVSYFILHELKTVHTGRCEFHSKMSHPMLLLRTIAYFPRGTGVLGETGHRFSHPWPQSPPLSTAPTARETTVFRPRTHSPESFHAMPSECLTLLW